jgi:Mrp family chromosome partitioning ATPase
LAEFSADADIVLIDSPPVLSIADTAALVSWVDGVIFVVESGKTRPATAQQALSNLHQVGANIVGAVLNSVPPKLSPYNYYHSPSSPDSKDEKRLSRRNIISPTKEWVKNRNNEPSFFERVQIKEFLPSIRGWIQSKRGKA